MPFESIPAIPHSEADQVRELQRMLQLGSPAFQGLDGERIELPPSIFEALKQVVNLMRGGHVINLVPAEERMTTQSAANFLGVSRPYLVRLLDEKRIPSSKVGTHRRILFKDVVQYAARRDAERHKTLEELIRHAAESGDYEATEIPEGGTDI